jgi:hypothetical protein
MASQTLSRAQTVISAMQRTHVARANAARAVQVSRPSQIAIFGPQRSIAIRSRKLSTVSVTANGDGLTIDLRGKLTSLT